MSFVPPDLRSKTNTTSGLVWKKQAQRHRTCSRRGAFLRVRTTVFDRVRGFGNQKSGKQFTRLDGGMNEGIDDVTNEGTNAGTSD